MFLGKYGEEFTCLVPLIIAGEVNFAGSGDFTHATGDTKVSKDEAAFANVTTAPTNVGTMWKFTLSATEMQCKRATVQLIDSATKAVEDQSFTVQTYGHASAQIKADLDNVGLGQRLAVDVEGWNGTAVPAEHTAGYPIVTVKDGTGTGEIDTTSGRVDVGKWLGTAVTTSATTLKPEVDVYGISDDATAANNAAAAFDGLTGYTFTNSVMPTVTTLTGHTAQTGDNFALLGTVSNLGGGATIGANLSDIAGATFSTATDSLEAIRNRGDAAWTTGGAGSDRLLMVDTTIATLSSQTSFTLTAGSTDDDAYNGCTIVIEDVSTSTQKAVGIVDDYTGSTKTVTLLEDPGVFVMAATDKVYILAEKSLKPTTAANYHVDVTANGNVGIDWGNVDNPTTAVDLSATDIQLCDTITTYTGNTVQTGDSYARLGAPAGASVSADVAAVKTDTAAVLVDTADMQPKLGTVTDLGGGGTIGANLSDMAGATFSTTTDTLEAIRDRGDAAWTTGAGGSDRLLMVDTTIATLSSQTSFTLTAGSTDDDAYNGCTIVIEDVSTSTQKAIGIVDDYTGSTKTVTLLEDPGVFVMAATDKVYILAEKGLKPTTAANYHVDVSAAGCVGIDWANIDAPTTAVDLSGTDIQLCDTITTYTGNTVQTGDSFARLGAPAGVSVSADVAAVKVDTAAILVDTADMQPKLGTPAGADMSADIAAVKAETALIVADTNELQTDWADGGRLDVILDATATAADVNAQVLDVLNVDTFAQPGQGTPAATTTLVTQIGYLYKAWRNKSDQDATTYQLYNDDASTVDQKATVSDDATTFTRGEVATGP